MQSPTQANSGQTPATTAPTEQPADTGTDAQPAQPQPHKKTECDAPVETVAVTTTPQEHEEAAAQTAEMPANVTVAQAVENKTAVQTPSGPSESCGGMEEMDSTIKTSEPAVSDTKMNPLCDVQKETKQDKGQCDGRRYVLSKKAMIDPLKMDMSEPLVTPPTSPQLSLQCIECHIIFRDPKSKERHLKLSHPAEYEQCILRNSLFACYICDRHFTNSTELMAHQKAHTEKTPYKCPICDRSFKRSKELSIHKKTHFGREGYACTDCGKSCKTMTLLKYHQRKHTGDMPYICKECGKRFPMSKALQRHILSHLMEEASAQATTNDGGSTVTYPCSICKGTFKSVKTWAKHLKTKTHMLCAAAKNATPAGQQNTPIITPISFCQPGLLQLEPNGPLQKVDSKIDTDQICRLIESLGNVQKVNQVVILGQVPLHAQPLELQQIPQLAQPVNGSPPQMDIMGLKQSESKMIEFDTFNNHCDPMEQTIILEPITPDGQLENPSFSELSSHIATGENIELTLVQAEQTEGLEGHVMHQIIQPDISAIQSDPMGQTVFSNEQVDLEQNLEQTVILELTPALIPTSELEQSQIVPHDEIQPSSLLPTTELEKTPDLTEIDEQKNSLSVPPLMSTVELELTTLPTEKTDLLSSPLVPLDTPTQALIKSIKTYKRIKNTNPKKDNKVNSQIQTLSLEQIRSVMDRVAAEERQKTAEQEVSAQEPSEKLLDEKESPEQLSSVEDTSAKEKVLETKQVPQTSELPVNVMSAQELVKVRKRKPASAFHFQGYLQEQIRSAYNDDFQIEARPVKRPKTKKSHLVVKFGPQSKEKKNKKQKKPKQQKPTQEQITSTISEKKATPQKKGKMGEKDRKLGHLTSKVEIKSSSPTQDPQMKQFKEHVRETKMKKQNEEAREGMMQINEHKTVASPVFKRKKQGKLMQKDQPKNIKDGKRKKNLTKEKVNKKAGTVSQDPPITTNPQDSLLLLKGHKQPQLKVYKLDPSKASSQSPEASPHESQTMPQQNKDDTFPTSDSTTYQNAMCTKKGGRPKKNQKALSLLSSLQVSCQPQEMQPTKPKTARKRKASSKIETEGVITSKRALECKDCGERFSELSSLQKHKAKVHIIESPGLTYTNGNVFEGVSSLDFYQLPKQPDKLDGVNAAADWDTEPELVDVALEDKERTISYPALIPSPSLPVSLPDDKVNSYESKSGSKTEVDDESQTSLELDSPSNQLKNNEISPNVTSESSLSNSAKQNILETAEPLAPEEAKQEKVTQNHPSSESELQVNTDEDIKDNLLLEVDLITVGEQNERDDPISPRESFTQNNLEGTCFSESEGAETISAPGQAVEKTMEKTLTSVSCSTHQVEIKEEEEEMLVQKTKGQKGTGTKKAPGERTREKGHLKTGVTSKIVLGGDSVRGTELDKERDECRVVYEEHSINSDTEIHEEVETDIKLSQPEPSPDLEANKAPAPAPVPAPFACLPLVPSAVDKSPEERTVAELESVTTSVEEVMNEGGLRGGEEHDGETDQSPCIILEKFLTSRQRESADKELSPMSASDNPRQGLDSIVEIEVHGSQEIKVEESVTDPLLFVPTGQNRKGTSVQQQHHDIRSVLVKEEKSLMLSEAHASQGSSRIRWNVEPVNNENTATPLMQSEESSECCITPEFNTNQCIFYPVKEEEREVLLEATETSRGSLTPEGSSANQQTELQSADSSLYEGSHSSQDHQDIRGFSSDFADGQVDADAEWPNPPDLRDFLLQSSDEEETGAHEPPDPPLDSEDLVLAYFSKNEINDSRQPDQALENISTIQLQDTREQNRTSQPIDYFSTYFGWDTWVDIANCTNKLSIRKPNSVSAREVAQFVGIHIAMGTLKFPSPRLYWEDFTKVPLIADAMPRSRFLELSYMLKLASPKEDPVDSSVEEERHDGKFVNGQQSKTLPSGQCIVSQHADRQRQCDKPNNLEDSKPQTDPLWKVQTILSRFNAGCQALRREGDYAVDQYLLPLTGKLHNNKCSLHCTSLLGFGGLLLHVDLKLNLSDKEDAVDKMIPKGSMVFLCKQELSTPAMLERLLVAGVHGAGRVGGAQGQIGDEFVSSDGKLMLRKSHCGFILSTAGNGQRNMASLIDNFEKAQMLARFNRDLRNLYPIPLTASAPTCWPQAVLWYITDLALVNSWLQYRQDHRLPSAPLTLMTFRLEVAKALILSSGCDTQDSVPPQPPTEKSKTANETPTPSLVEESPLPDAATRYDGSGHWPEQLGEGQGGRCSFGDCQRTSRVLCLKCCVFLCISRNHNCFLNFHNQGSSGKE